MQFPPLPFFTLWACGKSSLSRPNLSLIHTPDKQLHCGLRFMGCDLGTKVYLTSLDVKLVKFLIINPRKIKNKLMPFPHSVTLQITVLGL